MSGPRLIWDLQAELGEGALWDRRDAAFWFTDIKKRKIYRYEPATKAGGQWDSPEQVGFVVPAQSGGFIAGLQSGLHRFDPDSGAFDLIVEVEPGTPTNRLNDAAVDGDGRLWFGTMDDGEKDRTGAFYCFHRGELRETGIANIRITNGPALSPDGGTLYWVDTLGRTISAAEVGEDTSLGTSRELIRIDPADGHPDGPTVDSNGDIWIALYGGWEARRYSPAGKLLESVRFPVANITKVAFGGADMRTGLATTARQKLSAEAIEEQPLAGGVFLFETQTPGRASPAVADR